MDKKKTKPQLRLEERTIQLQMKHFLYYELIAGKDISQMPCKLDNYWVIIDDIPVPYMQCIQCKEFKPIYPVYFSIGHMARWGIFENWLYHYEPGYETFRNTVSTPCNVCLSKLAYNKARTNKSKFWSLRAKMFKNISGENLKEKFDAQEYGPVSGVPIMYMIEQTGHLLAPGAHDLQRIHIQNNTKYNPNEHCIETCVLDYSFLNVQQGTRIPDLIQTTIEGYKNTCQYYSMSTEQRDEFHNNLKHFYIEWYNRTPIENGITITRKESELGYGREMKKKHFKRIIIIKANNHNQIDKKANRPVEMTIRKKELSLWYLDIFLKGGCVCDVCKVPMTAAKNLWTDVHFDRIDNSRPHLAEGNLRTVCALHQVPGKSGRHYTHNMHLHVLCIQKHFELDEKLRKLFVEMHVSDECPFCDIQVLK